MNKKLRAMLDRKAKLMSEARKLSKADDPAHEMSDEERGQFDALMSQVETLNADIDREKALIEAERDAPGYQVSDDAIVSGGAPRIELDPRRGFSSMAQFCVDVRNAAANRALSERLQLAAAAPGAFANENIGADGGFLVPPAFSTEIFTIAQEGDAILPMTDNLPVAGNGMTFPKDETTPWGNEGVRAYWEDEATEATASKPKGGVTQNRLKKLTALVPVTEELMEDAPALSGFAVGKMGEAVRWKSNDSLVHGNGVGRPLGILKADARVVVAKEGGQAAKTIKVENVANMFSRMSAASLARSRWMINSDALPQLITMTLNGHPIWTPPGALKDAPAGLLLGRPIMLSEHCDTIGEEGDIMLVDWSQYRSITKSGGVRTDSSMHLYFDLGMTAFRMTFRLDGAPKLSKPVSPARGTATKSPFVVLAQRA